MYNTEKFILPANQFAFFKENMWFVYNEKNIFFQKDYDIFRFTIFIQAYIYLRYEYNYILNEKVFVFI